MIEKENSFTIKVPKGIPEGHTMIIKNKGSYNFDIFQFKIIEI